MVANFLLKTITGALLFILLIIAGVILHRLGKPYHSIAFNVHKLLTVAWVIIMVILVRHHYIASLNDRLLSVSLAVSLLGLMTLFFSGGMMSLDRMQELMLQVHRAASLTLLISVPLVFYSIIWSYSNMFKL